MVKASNKYIIMKTSDTWEVPLPKDEKLTAKELNIEDLTAKLDN